MDFHNLKKMVSILRVLLQMAIATQRKELEMCAFSWLER